MAVANKIDPAAAKTALTAWLADKRPGAEVNDVALPSGSGGSSETVMFTLAWFEDGAEHDERLVARVMPSGGSVFPDYDAERQFRVMDVLSTQTSLPVPAVRWLESDVAVLGAPFFVMPCVEGRILRDDPPFTLTGWLLEEPAHRQRELHANALQVMVDLHATDWRSLGLGFLERPELGRAGIDQEIRYYQEYFAWAANGERNPTIEAALAWVESNTPEPSVDPVLCHGDARVGNMIFGDDLQVRAMLDWETVQLSEPEYDLAWWLLLNLHHSDGIGAPLPPGFPTREQIIAEYEALSGRVVRDMFFYDVFAAMRLSMMMVRSAHLMKAAGLLPAESAMAINNPASQILARLLALPAPDTGETTSFFGSLQ
jgi:aminoglycoside phosphotransferase (APT) family kinase protein